MRYDINPFMPRRAYRLPKANIALEGNIANHARDLYRCVFSVKENTLICPFLFYLLHSPRVCSHTPHARDIYYSMFFDELKLKLNLEDVVHFSVTILGRNAVVIEGVKNVVFSNENQLKARVKKCVVSVSGEGLKIKEIGDGNILISGVINGVQYE